MNLNSCFYHPNLPASIVCNRCGRRICDSCRKPYNGLTLCPSCYHTVPVAPSSVPPSVAPPPGAPIPTPIPVVGGYGPPKPAGWYGPYIQMPILVRHWWIPAALVAIAGGLIIANSVALLSPGFAAFWGSIIPWLTSLGAFSFILGIVLGLVLLGSVIMIYLRFKVLSAFVIFPAALVSILVGGGFLLGTILAVLAGILLLL